MDLICYDDGRPLSPQESAVLAVRKQREAGAPAADERVLFHIDCFPAESDEWIQVRRGPAGLLHETPP